ncbi:MAG: hypothetical protein ACLFN1_09425 [Bacteroidales bacterium]
MKLLAGFIIIAVLAFGIFMLVKLLLVIARRVEDKDNETFEKRKN